MKIIAAGLLLTITGFLQETKCMFFPDLVPSVKVGDRTGTVHLKLGDSMEINAVLYQAHVIPAWVEDSIETKNFEHYAVYIHTFFNLNHLTTDVQDIWVSRFLHPVSATIMLGQSNFKSDVDGFKTYDHKTPVNGYYVNRIYVAVKGTKKIFSATMVPAVSAFQTVPAVPAVPKVEAVPTNMIATGEPSGTISVAFKKGHFTASLFPAQNVPAWLLTPPTEKFENYEVFINSPSHKNHQTTYIHGNSKGPGFYPILFTITLQKKIGQDIQEDTLVSASKNFIAYNPNMFLNSIDRIYIAVGGTDVIKCADIKYLRSEIKVPKVEIENPKKRNIYNTEASSSKKWREI